MIDPKEKGRPGKGEMTTKAMWNSGKKNRGEKRGFFAARETPLRRRADGATIKKGRGMPIVRQKFVGRGSGSKRKRPCPRARPKKRRNGTPSKTRNHMGREKKCRSEKGGLEREGKKKNSRLRAPQRPSGIRNPYHNPRRERSHQKFEAASTPI